MDQGHPINNRTVKFVVSCCIVSKQVEVGTILESVQTKIKFCNQRKLLIYTGLKSSLRVIEWYAYCLGYLHFTSRNGFPKSSGTISTFHSNIQWRGWHHAISFNKQVHTIPHPVLQVPACSQEAVDSTDTNIGNKKYRYILRTIQRVLGKCWVGEQELLSPSYTLIYSSSYFCTTSLQN